MKVLGLLMGVKGFKEGGVNAGGGVKLRGGVNEGGGGGS